MDAEQLDPAQPAGLWDDARGEKIEGGRLDEMQARYHKMLKDGFPAADLFIELDGGDQIAWNPNVSPPRWDEL
jgi:hypothetical protein